MPTLPEPPLQAAHLAGAALRIEYKPLAALRPALRNPRIHSPKQTRQIANSIERFGFTNPVLLDANGGIIAGHGRAAAARLLGLDSVPTLRLDHLGEAERRAYALADNKLAENAGWDPKLLALELQYVTELDIDFDLTVTGFETAEIDLLFDSLDPVAAADPADAPPEPAPGPPVSRPGDLWQLGRHRLLCADATQEPAFARLMAGEQARMVFTDPPYNVPIAGHVCGAGRVQHREFAMAAGEMDEQAFTGFLTTVLGHLARHSQDGAVNFIFMDWRHLGELLAAGRAVYSELKNLIVWNKSNAGMGTFYRSKHELILAFKAGTAPHVNTFELGQHGRYRSNVWDYPGVNSFRPERLEELRMHPTVKPVAMVADAIRDCSHRGEAVLDAFCGSGTTLVAAERAGRVGRALEIDPAYVDTAVRRWQALTGEAATLAETGLAFDAVAAERAAAETWETVDAG